MCCKNNNYRVEPIPLNSGVGADVDWLEAI